MAKQKFNFEVELRYRNYINEEITTGTIGKFSSKNLADFFAESYTKDLERNNKENAWYCVVVER